MIKVFTTNKDGKIELTKDELKALLDEAYWEGFRNNSHSYIYTSPYTPYVWTANSVGLNQVTLTSSMATESNTGESIFATGMTAEV